MKKLSFILIALFVLGGSAVAFAWWDTLSQTEEETLTIGNGVVLQVAAVAEAPVGKVLVPAGVVLKANDLESIVLTYNVKLDLEAVEALDLDVVASDIEIGGSTANAGLVQIAIVQAANEVNAENVLITVTVTLNMPASEAVYNAIKNQPITFTLTFTATQVE